jgi:hypothetical protein
LRVLGHFASLTIQPNSNDAWDSHEEDPVKLHYHRIGVERKPRKIIRFLASQKGKALV